MSSSCICSKPKICSATGNCICDTSLNFQARGQGCQCPEVWGYTTSEDGLSCVWSGSTVALLVLCCMLWLATGWIGALYAKFCYREVVFEHTLVKNTLRQSRSHTNVRSSDTKKKSIFSPTWKKRKYLRVRTLLTATNIGTMFFLFSSLFLNAFLALSIFRSYNVLHFHKFQNAVYWALWPSQRLSIFGLISFMYSWLGIDRNPHSPRTRKKKNLNTIFSRLAMFNIVLFVIITAFWAKWSSESTFDRLMVIGLYTSMTAFGVVTIMVIAAGWRLIRILELSTAEVTTVEKYSFQIYGILVKKTMCRLAITQIFQLAFSLALQSTASIRKDPWGGAYYFNFLSIFCQFLTELTFYLYAYESHHLFVSSPTRCMVKQLNKIIEEIEKESSTGSPTNPSTILTMLSSRRRRLGNGKQRAQPQRIGRGLTLHGNVIKYQNALYQMSDIERGSDNSADK